MFVAVVDIFRTEPIKSTYTGIRDIFVKLHYQSHWTYLSYVHAVYCEIRVGMNLLSVEDLLHRHRPNSLIPSSGLVSMSTRAAQA